MQSVYKALLVDLFVKVFVIFYTVDALHSVKIFFTKTFLVFPNGVFFNLFLQTHKHSRHKHSPVVLKTAILTSFESVLENIRARI